MLNIVKLLLFSLVLVTISCGKEDSESGLSAGVWNLKEATCNDGKSVTSIPGDDDLILNFTSTGKNYAATVTFKDDGTYSSGGTYTAVLSLEFGGQTQTQEVPIPEFAGSGKWKLDGNTLTVTDNQGNKSTAEVLENTDDKFRYKAVINRVDNSNPDFTITQTGTYFFTLER